MPLIKPEIAKVLREAGVTKSAPPREIGFEKSLTEAGLSQEALAEELTSIALRNQNDVLRLRALEIALKIKGALKETPTQLPNFSITIQNSNTSLAETQGQNPCLFPRQSYDTCKVLDVESEESEDTSGEEESWVGHMSMQGNPGQKKRK